MITEDALPHTNTPAAGGRGWGRVAPREPRTCQCPEPPRQPVPSDPPTGTIPIPSWLLTRPCSRWGALNTSLCAEQTSGLGPRPAAACPSPQAGVRPGPADTGILNSTVFLGPLQTRVKMFCHKWDYTRKRPCTRAEHQHATVSAPASASKRKGGRGSTDASVCRALVQSWEPAPGVSRLATVPRLWL